MLTIIASIFDQEQLNIGLVALQLADYSKTTEVNVSLI